MAPHTSVLNTMQRVLHILRTYTKPLHDFNTTYRQYDINTPIKEISSLIHKQYKNLH